MKHVCKIWNICLPLTRFLSLSLNEKLLLLNFSSHFFHLFPCLGILGLKVNSTFHAGISRRPSGGLFIFFIRVIQIYFGVLKGGGGGGVALERIFFFGRSERPKNIGTEQFF